MDPSTTLDDMPSLEKPPDPVPAYDPAVTVSLALRMVPCAGRQRADVSEAQAVASHAVGPTDADMLDCTRPIPAPSTVTAADPVSARLARRRPLGATVP